MFNFLETIWNFLSSSFEQLINLLSNLVQILSICVFPFRWLGNVTSMFGSEPIEAAFAVIMFLGIILTVYRIFRGNV